MSRFHEEVFGVYFDDLDPFQILHNARYLLLFERTLGAFWMELGFGDFQDSDHPEQFHLVRQNEVEYLSPVRGVGKVRIRVSVERIGETSLTFGFRMMPLDRDVDHARGRRTVVHVDRETLRSRPWPESLRAAIRPWIADEDG
jgi:acyl-CoA thioester hydrolase